MAWFNHQLEIQDPILCEFFFVRVCTPFFKPTVLYGIYFHRRWATRSYVTRVTSLIVPSPPYRGLNHHEWCWKNHRLKLQEQKAQADLVFDPTVSQGAVLEAQTEWETLEKSGLKRTFAVFLLSCGGICGGNGVFSHCWINIINQVLKRSIA